MKRVYCLYRVSTLGQVDKEDIPMQREACQEFAKSKGWVITEEFSEKGISGFKVSSENREALQSIKKAAIQKQFDVLLVFMFDRLGRRDDETPFIVEWFVKNGIEVWSVVEGEQRFEDHVDKLLNYIRYWQSSGESLKTSIRTKTRMEQLVKEGLFVGGSPPYGYKICKLGRTNKHGFEVHDILIDQKESEVVKTIFDLYCSGQMGTHCIANHLTNKGISTRQGVIWHHSSILNILKNSTYTGVRKFGDTQSDHFPHLQIIDRETFDIAQNQVKANKLMRPQALNSSHKSAVLFIDVMYCMNCSKKMTVTRNRNVRQNKNGTQSVYDRIRYICINKSNNPYCEGQKTYSSKSVDEILFNALNDFFLSKNIEELKLNIKDPDCTANKIVALELALKQEERTLQDLKSEVVEVIRGTSAFGSVLISDLIQKSDSRIIELTNEITLLCDVERNQKVQINKLQKLCGQFDLFPSLELNEQKEIIKQIVVRVYIGTGYKYRIEWTFGGYIEN